MIPVGEITISASLECPSFKVAFSSRKSRVIESSIIKRHVTQCLQADALVNKSEFTGVKLARLVSPN
jgi:hypothetical protein